MQKRNSRPKKKKAANIRLPTSAESSTDSDVATATKVFLQPFLSLIINRHESVFVFSFPCRNESVDATNIGMPQCIDLTGPKSVARQTLATLSASGKAAVETAIGWMYEPQAPQGTSILMPCHFIKLIYA